MAQVVSWSEIDAARQCPQKHKWAYVDRWTGGDSDALDLGSAFHLVMEAHYLAVAKNEDVAKAVYAVLDPMRGRTVRVRIGNQKEEVDLVNHLLWMYDGYVEMYGFDPGWKIRAVEWSANVPLRHPSKTGEPAKGKASRFRAKVKIDLVVELAGDIGGLWVVDHKTAGQMPNDKEFEFDDQFGLYTWAMRELGKPIVGSIHNCIVTGRNKVKPTELDKRFKRTPMHRNPHELDVVAHEALVTVQERYRAGAEVRRTPNPDTCRWRCSYTDTCLDVRKGYADEHELFIARGYVQDHVRH